MKAQVTSIARHRNGISGNPFFIALINDEQMVQLVAIVPEQAVESGKHNEETGLYECCVLDPAAAVDGHIEFGVNSFRGDHYFKMVVEAAKKHLVEM